MPPLPPNSFITVTGISGHVASWVGLEALKAGHRVRGTVRSLDRAQAVKDAYAKQGITDMDSRLEFVIVDDLLSTDQYLRALKGVDGVLHISQLMDSYFKYSFVKDSEEVVIALLRAAKQVPSLKRVVLTSSIGAIVLPPFFVDHKLTDQDWNDASVKTVEEDVANGKTDTAPLAIYCAGKTNSEKAAWRFVDEEKPQFDLVTIIPNINFGPMLVGPPRSSATLLAAVFANNAEIFKLIGGQWWIDIRDDARLHVLSLTEPSVSGKRLIAITGGFGWNNILSILRKHFPHAELPADLPGAEGEVCKHEIDTSLATKLLGGYISLEESLVDHAKSLGYSPSM